MFDLDDDELWTRFHDGSLSAAQWTHGAHLRMAWLYLARHELDEAHLRLRVGIIRLNAHHGLVETATRGYHETLTRVWLILVAAARRGAGHASAAAFVGAAPIDRDTPLRHYTRERLFSTAARATWQPPDLVDLPRVD